VAMNCRLLHAYDRAEDASQEVLLRLLRYTDFRNLQEPQAFYAYLHQMCRNISRERFLQQKEVSSQPLEEGTEEQSRLRSPSELPDRKAEIEDLISKILGRLNDRDRRITKLLMQECELSEIAHQVGLRYFTAGAHLCRLRAKLRILKELLQHIKKDTDKKISRLVKTNVKS
jgi:RNA polymerase sigma factor (sigma-70 family)